MTAQTLNDVLSQTRTFHNQLSQRLASSAESSKDTRVHLLLDFLREHEERLSHALEVIQQTADSKQLDTWFYEFTQKHNVVRRGPPPGSYADTDTNEIMRDVMEEHKQVIELYRYLYGRAGTAPARELLSQLIDLEEHEAMLVSQEGNRAQDM